MDYYDALFKMGIATVVSLTLLAVILTLAPEGLLSDSFVKLILALVIFIGLGFTTYFGFKAIDNE